MEILINPTKVTLEWGEVNNVFGPIVNVKNSHYITVAKIAIEYRPKVYLVSMKYQDKIYTVTIEFDLDFTELKIKQAIEYLLNQVNMTMGENAVQSL